MSQTPLTDAFEEWLQEFVESLGQHISQAQADKFLHVYREEALRHYRAGMTPWQAVKKELL